jgi:hypothetical protein
MKTTILETVRVAMCLALLGATAMPVRAGTSSAQSNITTVDTRDGNRPVVQDVTSAYCGGGKQRACFLDGVSLSQTFTVLPNWNGKTPASIKFIGPWGTHTQSGTQTARTYNVGTEFGPGGTLSVVLAASDGTESLPYRVNFDVAPRPPIVGPLLYLGSLTELVYRTPSFDLDLFDGPSGPVGGGLAGLLPGETMGVSPMFRAEAQVDGSGVLTIDAVGGKKNEIKLNGTQNRRPDGKFGEAAGVDFGLGIEGELQVKYDPAAAQWVVDAGFLGVNAFGEFASAPIYIYTPPPVYFRYEISGDLSVGIRVLGLSSSEGLNPEFLLSTESFPEIKGIVGCGVGGLLAVEGYAALAGKFEFTAPPVVCQRLGIGGKIGVQLVVIGYASAPFDIYSGTYWIVGGEGASGMLPLSAGEVERLQTLINRLDSSAFSPLPRRYLKSSTPYSLFLADKLVRPNFWGDPVSTGVPLTLQTNIFPYSEPALGVSDAHRILLVVTDNPARSDENRTELVWSKWDGGTWLNPTSVWNDATGDFAPAVGVFPDGKALAVWQNEGAVLPTGATLDQALGGLEIASGWLDPVSGTWSCSNLTENLIADHSPQLAAGTNGRALLTWISNPSNSPCGSLAAPNTLHSRVWTGAAWQDPGDIATGVGMVLWSTVAFDGTNGALVAVVDPDDDQSTITNQELWGATFDGVQWSVFAPLTTNVVQDTKPQAAFDSAGRFLMAWYQDTNLVMHTGAMNVLNPTAIGAVGGASAAKDFRLITDPAGQVTMLWEDVVEGGAGPEPLVFNYDAALNNWSQPVRLLANSNILERSFSGAYADSGSLLLAYNQVRIQTDTDGVPVFTNSPVDLMYLNYQIGGDLGLAASDILFSTNNPAPGQTVTISALVHNLGEKAATNVQVVFYDGHPSGGGTMIGSTQTVAGVLSAGSNATVQVSWIVPQTTSNRTVYVVVDPGQLLEDRNRANNTASQPVLAPDLQINDMTVLQPSATNRILNAQCVNAGVVPSGGAVDVVFRRGATNGPVLATVPIASLPTNGMYDASFEWNLAGLTFTNAFELVYATVDAGDLVSEADEDNNARVVSVMTSLDRDSDGLLDGEEASYGTDPLLADTDRDGLSDFAEVRTHGTNPLLADRPHLQPAEPGAGGFFSLTLSEVLERAVAVEVSTDLTTWSSLTNFPAGSAAITFEDASATNAQRFYRARLAP